MTKSLSTARILVFLVSALSVLAQVCRDVEGNELSFLSEDEVRALETVSLHFIQYRHSNGHPATVSVFLQNESTRRLQGYIRLYINHSDRFGNQKIRSSSLIHIQLDSGERLLATTFCGDSSEDAETRLDYRDRSGNASIFRPRVERLVQLSDDLPESCDGTWNPEHSQTADLGLVYDPAAAKREVQLDPLTSASPAAAGLCVRQWAS